jgi:UDP-N-acetylmuramate dehydrogenase
MEFRLREGAPLKDYCTYKIGGPARFFFEPPDFDGLSTAVQWANDSRTRFFIMGEGSNVLVSDQGYDGLVIYTGNTLQRIKAAGSTVKAACGAPLKALIARCADLGLSGLENLYGIPGTVGGAVYMNAGAFDSAVSDCLASVLSMEKNGTRVLRKKDGIAFGYRDSIYRKNGEVILEAAFDLRPADPGKIRAAMQAIETRRNARQPSYAACCGSVFKRPKGNYAGALIEQAGLKGMRQGGARVSEKHANFIENDKNALAQDVRALIEKVRKIVFEKSGVMLEPEVVFLGEF